jgi:hypothetical protein
MKNNRELAEVVSSYRLPHERFTRFMISCSHLL